jgi:hypothetical protein
MASSTGEPPPTRHPDDDVVSGGSGATVSFPELLWAHTLFGRSRKDPASRAEASRNYESLMAAFERTHGPIVNSFWGEDGTTAVVLTGGRRPRLGGLFCRETAPRLHVLSGGLSEAPRASELLHRCDELATRASFLLTGTSRRVALEWLFAVGARLLGVAEFGSAKPKREHAEAAFGQLDADLRKIGEYAERASENITRLRYFWGMLLGLLIVTIGTVVAEVTTGSIATVDRVTAAVAAGALGAVMSVMQRMSAGRIGLDTDLDRATIVRLGAFRPFIGAVLGGFVYLLFAAEVVVVLPTGSTNSTSVYTYAVIGFLAGFAERWVRVLVEPSTSLRQEELAERIPAAVEESVRAALLGPVLARWHGFVSASVAGQEAADGASRLRPLEQAELTIRFAQKETGSASERRIDIREGEEAPEVSFMLRLDSDTVSLPYSEQTMAVPAEGMAATAMSFTAPKAPGLYQLWLRVSQRNRVVQIVPFEFEIVD